MILTLRHNIKVEHSLPFHKNLSRKTVYIIFSVQFSSEINEILQRGICR